MIVAGNAKEVPSGPRMYAWPIVPRGGFEAAVIVTTRVFVSAPAGIRSVTQPSIDRREPPAGPMAAEPRSELPSFREGKFDPRQLAAVAPTTIRAQRREIEVFVRPNLLLVVGASSPLAVPSSKPRVLLFPLNSDNILLSGRRFAQSSPVGISGRLPGPKGRLRVAGRLLQRDSVDASDLPDTAHVDARPRRKVRRKV